MSPDDLWRIGHMLDAIRAALGFVEGRLRPLSDSLMAGRAPTSTAMRCFCSRWFPHVDTAFPVAFDAALQALASLTAVVRASRNTVALPLFLTGTAQRDALSERLVSGLLLGAGLVRGA